MPLKRTGRTARSPVSLLLLNSQDQLCRFPHYPKAVPWSTLVRIIGRPTVMLTPALRPSGPCPGSSYIATTISKSPLTTLKKSVPAGSGPNACGQRQEQFSLLLLHVQTNHSHRHGGSCRIRRFSAAECLRE